MKVLVVGPSETGARGGMAAVIRDIRESGTLGREFEIHTFPSYIDGSLPRRLLYCAWAYLRFLSCYRAYVLFHLHTAERGSALRKAAYLRAIKRAGKRAVVHVHGAEFLDFYDGLGPWRRGIVDRLFHRADLVLALSEGWRRELEARFHTGNCRVLHNGVDPARLGAAVSDPAEHPHSFVMLGRLGARKGAYDLVEAAALAVERDPALSIVMAGDGEVEQVRALAAERGLEGCVTVLGWVDGPRKLELLKNAAAVVLPSYHEGLPMAVLEGMAAGKAIISTTVGAIPEAVGEENGILVEPGDIPALARALAELGGDTQRLRRMSAANRARAEAVFSLQETHRALAECYRRAAEGGGETWS